MRYKINPQERAVILALLHKEIAAGSGDYDVLLGLTKKLECYARGGLRGLT